MAFDYWQDLIPGGIYHLYNRSIGHERLFRSSSDYKGFLTKFNHYFSPYFDIYAYCLIPNHFHFLVQVKTEIPEIRILDEKSKAAKKFLSGEGTFNEFLEDQFRRFFSSYAMKYNLLYNRTGSLFQKKVKRVGITNDVKLVRLICYIHHNPIHHKLTLSYENWSYSSYVNYLANDESLIAKSSIFELLGNGDKNFGELTFWQAHQDFKFDENENWVINDE